MLAFFDLFRFWRSRIAERVCVQQSIHTMPQFNLSKLFVLNSCAGGKSPNSISVVSLICTVYPIHAFLLIAISYHEINDLTL